jgi:hypothetical protein
LQRNSYLEQRRRGFSPLRSGVVCGEGGARVDGEVCGNGVTPQALHAPRLPFPAPWMAAVASKDAPNEFQVHVHPVCSVPGPPYHQNRGTSPSPAKREVGKRGRGGQKNKTSAGGLVLGLVVFGGVGAPLGAPKWPREPREGGASGALRQPPCKHVIADGHILHRVCRTSF